MYGACGRRIPLATIAVNVVEAIGQEKGKDGQWVDIRKSDDLDSGILHGTEMRRNSQICRTKKLLACYALSTC